MDTPTARHLQAAQQPQTIRDAEGRSLTIRRLTALDRLRLFKACGPTLAQNHLWLGMATLACSVSSIDDIPIPAPGNEAQIEALVSRLGDAGLSAVAQSLSPLHTDPVTHAGN